MWSVFPLQAPQFGFEDFVKADRQPVEQAAIRPPPTDALDPVADLAEVAFDCIGGQRKRLPMLQPPVEEGGHGFDQVFDVGPGLGIGFKGLEKVLEALLRLLGQLLHPGAVLRPQFLQLRLGHRHGGNGVELVDQRLLIGFFKLIGIQKYGKSGLPCHTQR